MSAKDHRNRSPTPDPRGLAPLYSPHLWQGQALEEESTSLGSYHREAGERYREPRGNPKPPNLQVRGFKERSDVVCWSLAFSKFVPEG